MQTKHYNRIQNQDKQSLKSFLDSIDNKQLKSDIIKMLKNGLINANQAQNIVKQCITVEYV